MSPNYDCCTIWDRYRGVDPGGDAGRASAGVADLEQLRDDGVVDQSTSRAIAEHAQRRLRAIGLFGDRLEDHEIMVHLDGRGRPLRDAAGTPLITFCVDALTACESDLLTEQHYRDLMAGFDERLRAVDCEILNPSGSHLLLSMDPDGRFQVDERGDVAVTLCNFELIRGLYRPFR